MLKKHWKLISLMAVVCLALCIGAVATKRAMDRETEVSIKEVPAAVKVTLLAEAKGGTIEEIEMETENGRTVYEADVIIDGQEVEIQVAPDGTLLGKEIEDNDEGDDDDDEGDDDDEDEDEDEEEVSLDDVPAAVKATILKEAAGAEIEEVDKETEDGQTVYEAEFEADGKEIEIEVATDGTLLERETEEDDDD
jgi:uncharacterized membrane protein YkoI